ncbi:MAG: polysaccharide deacetylase family protein, partial [Bacteroidota bacterium]
MFVERTSKILQLFIPAIWNIKDGTRSIYLTFDDGPCPEVTPKVLDILDKYNIKATFFCVGDNVRRHPQIFDLLIKNGHRVGNHTMHHIKGFNTSCNEYLRDVEEAGTVIDSNLFRPPYGRITLRQLKELKKRYKVIMWDVITRDYNPRLKPDKCLSIVKKFSKPGSIIIFHDSQKSAANMLTALPMAILVCSQLMRAEVRKRLS